MSPLRMYFKKNNTEVFCKHTRAMYLCKNCLQITTKCFKRPHNYFLIGLISSKDELSSKIGIVPVQSDNDEY